MNEKIKKPLMVLLMLFETTICLLLIVGCGVGIVWSVYLFAYSIQTIPVSHHGFLEPFVDGLELSLFLFGVYCFSKIIDTLCSIFGSLVKRIGKFCRD